MYRANLKGEFKISWRGKIIIIKKKKGEKEKLQVRHRLLLKSLTAFRC